MITMCNKIIHHNLNLDANDNRIELENAMKICIVCETYYINPSKDQKTCECGGELA